MKNRHADVAVDVSPPRSALRFVILLGVTSLFADMTYEGARSITGPTSLFSAPVRPWSGSWPASGS